MTRPLRIALVAGEASGDILGSGLMQALKARHPDAEFIGVGGPLMEAEGLASYFPMERLAVMGLVEVLGRLPELLSRRKRLIATLIDARPDVFIGIDAPDFNLGVELKLRRAGIRTVHYVSPSVWAWRQKRVLKIREGCDLMLTLFPFEAQFYEAHQVPVRFVGHPLADTIPLEADRAAARTAIGVPDGAALVALMPGSRGGEVGRLGSLFLDAAAPMGINFGLCKQPVAAGKGSGDRLVDIHPGKPEESVLTYRVESTDPSVMMPELGRSSVHREGLDLLERWIAGLPGACRS